MTSDERRGQTTLIRDALVIDGTGRPPLPNTTIAIQGERITAVGPDAAFGEAGDRRVIDAAGMTVMPGLIDIHVHLTHLPEQTAPLYPAHGVTTVRDTGGLLSELVAWRSRFREGAAAGPRLFFCGPLLDTPPLVYPTITSIIETEASIEPEIERIAAAGAVAAKIYVGVRPELAAAIIACAREHGLPSIGDLGATSATAAIEAGIAGLEHAAAAYNDLVPPARQAPMTLFHEQGPAVWRREWNRSLAEADGSGPEAQRLARLIAERGVALDPTLVVLERLAHLDDPTITEALEVDLVPAEMRAGWEARAAGRKEQWSPADYAAAHQAYENLVAFTSEVFQQGGRILVGSDAPNPFVVPGVSLHRELELLVGAGMTPLQVLTAATHGNAMELGLGRELGTIAPGMTADLVLLAANPLEDIRLSRRINLVVQDGVIVASRMDEASRSEGC
jgi:imidazolonepropionase-like amidohydrolase